MRAGCNYRGGSCGRLSAGNAQLPRHTQPCSPSNEQQHGRGDSSYVSEAMD